MVSALIDWGIVKEIVEMMMVREQTPEKNAIGSHACSLQAEQRRETQQHPYPRECRSLSSAHSAMGDRVHG